MDELTQAQEVAVLDYMKRHIDLFKDKDFINYIRDDDVGSALNHARGYMTMDEGAFHIDAIRYNALLYGVTVILASCAKQN